MQSNDVSITITKGAVGISANVAAWRLSMHPEVEAWVRLISLLIGCCVGIITIISICRGMQRNRK